MKPATCPHLPGTTLLQTSAISSYCSYGLWAGLPASLPLQFIFHTAAGGSTENENQSLSLSPFLSLPLENPSCI